MMDNDRDHEVTADNLTDEQILNYWRSLPQDPLNPESLERRMCVLAMRSNAMSRINALAHIADAINARAKAVK